MTTSKTVLGFDGAPESRDALRLAAELADARGSEIIPVICHRLATLPVIVADSDPTVGEAESLVTEIKQELPGHDVLPRIAGASSPARALHDIAEVEQAETIVIGSTHRAGTARVIPGSVGERLLHGAPCEVAVAPRGYARGQNFGFGLIGVGYDGTEESRLALESARRLAATLDCQLRVIGVLPDDVSRAQNVWINAVERDEMRSRLEDAAELAGRTDADGRRATAEAVFREGDPAEVLADQGVELDLLVVGSRGRGPLMRTMLGGVSNRVIRIAPCPVLVVPRGSRSRPIAVNADDRLVSVG